MSAHATEIIGAATRKDSENYHWLITTLSLLTLPLRPFYLPVDADDSREYHWQLKTVDRLLRYVHEFRAEDGEEEGEERVGRRNRNRNTSPARIPSCALLPECHSLTVCHHAADLLELPKRLATLK